MRLSAPCSKFIQKAENSYRWIHSQKLSELLCIFLLLRGKATIP